jgi:hypothetical protein
VYLYQDTVDQTIGQRVLFADRDCPRPYRLYLTKAHEDISKRVLAAAKQVWPDILCKWIDSTDGSGDPFVVFSESQVRKLPIPIEVLK